jgi:hypothetical protein
MIALAAFVIRDAAAAVLFAMALGKIITPRVTAIEAWRPPGISAELAPAVIIALAVTEMTLAVTVLLAPAPAWVTVLPIVIFFGLVTSYGLAAITQTGSCVCGGGAAAQIRKSALIRRNALICLAATVGVTLGPSLHTLQAHSTRYALGGSIVPVAGFAVLVVFRAVQAKRLAPTSTSKHPAEEVRADPQIRQSHDQQIGGPAHAPY